MTLTSIRFSLFVLVNFLIQPLSSLDGQITCMRTSSYILAYKPLINPSSWKFVLLLRVCFKYIGLPVATLECQSMAKFFWCRTLKTWYYATATIISFPNQSVTELLNQRKKPRFQEKYQVWNLVFIKPKIFRRRSLSTMMNHNYNGASRMEKSTASSCNTKP